MVRKIKSLYQGWVRTGKKIAGFQIRLVFTLAYFLFILPLGLIVKLFFKLPRPGWHPAQEEPADIQQARRQF